MKYIFAVFFIINSLLLNSQTITISAVGDLMAHDTLQNYALSTKDGYLHLFDNTKKIFLGDDLSIANLETPIDDLQPIKGYPQFNAKSGYVDALKAAGFELVSISNNHTFDQGYEGVKETIKNFKQRKLSFSGAGLNKEQALTPVIINVKGIIIGFFSGTFSLNGLPYYDKRGEPHVNFYPMENGKKLEEFTGIIRKTKKTVDVMIAAYHCGEEYNSAPNALQEKILKSLADNGADIVLAHHPHVLQKIEYYTTADARNALIAYSLGNFISSQSRHLKFGEKDQDWIYDALLVRTAEGVILQLEVVKWENSIHIVNPRIIPTFNLNYPVFSGRSYYEGYNIDFMESIFKVDDTSDIRFSKNLVNAKKLIAYRYNKIKNLINIPVLLP